MYIFDVPTTLILQDVVFLLLLWLEGLGLLPVLVSSVSCMGSHKVTPLAVFLWLLGEGGASATWSILDVAANIGTLNATMPNLSM